MKARLLSGVGRRLNVSFGYRHLRLLTTLALLIALAFLSMIAAPRARAQSQADEYRVKAAFIYHFAQLVDWPSTSFTDANQPLSLCTWGDDPFHGELENSVQGKPVNSRTVSIRHIKKPQDARGCHVLFIARSDEKQVPEILMQLAANAILTVGESDRFAQQGGMIQFLVDDDKIRFTINVGSAQKCGLKISSKLLLLAKDVIGIPGGK